MDTRTADEAATLDQFYSELLQTLSPSAMLGRAVREVPELVGCHVAFIGELNSDNAMTISHGSGLRTDAIRGLEVVRNRGLGGRVIASLSPGWVNDYTHAVGITHDYDDAVATEGILAVSAVPILSPAGLWGVLYAGSRDELPFEDRSVGIMTKAAQRVSLALAVSNSARQSAALAAADAKRQIALNLHDTVGAALFSLSASLRGVNESFGENPALRDALRGIESQAALATKALRESMRSLSHPSENASLSASVLSLCDSFSERSGIPAETIVLGSCGQIDSSRRAIVEAVVKEALLNVEKHSNASCVVCTIAPYQGGTLTVVSDDGPAKAHEDAAREPTGLGLQRLRSEVDAAGGWASAGPNDDDGFTIRVWMPSVDAS